ncbi:M48 family metalloprotease [Streptomyces sp. NPDC021212]|uniref:M48 family metalloprotease n=1 Tax=Streptomyces sp. NPDC021212 TaxID=3365118 RepID=UPI00378D74DB
MAALERRSLPFLLPSATLTAFVLLIVAVLAFTVTLHPDYYNLIAGNAGTGSLHDCQGAAVARAGGIDAAARQWVAGGRVPGFAACGTSDHWTASYLIGCGLLCTATALHYWFRSGRRARRGGVRSIGPDLLPELHGELLRLADRTVPGTHVRFLLDLLDPAASGVAFGRARRRHVLLGRGVITLRERDPDAFEALVLHELAHLRNRDVDLTLITLGFLRAYAVLVFLPVALGRLLALALDYRPLLYGASAAQLAGLAALLVVARGQVLRIREYQADARVVRWQGRSEPLRRLLTVAHAEAGARAAHRAGVPRPAVRRRTGTWLRRVTGLHPTAASRAAALDAPAPLMSPGFGFALVLGACLTLVWDPSASPTAHFSVGEVWDWWRPEPFTILLMTILALATLRATIYHCACLGRPAPPPLLRLRFGLPLGLLTGIAVAPNLTAQQTMMPSSLGVEVGYGLLQAGLAWLLVMWSEYLAQAWAEAVATARRPWLTALVPCAAVGAVVLLALPPVYELHGQLTFSLHSGQVMSGLPGPLRVLFWSEAVLSTQYFIHTGWVLGASALLLGVPALGRYLGRRAPGPVTAVAPGPLPGPHPLRRRLTAAGVGCLTFFATSYAIVCYFDVMFGLLPQPVGLVVAGATAAAGAVAAVLARRHRVLLPMAVSATTAVGLVYAVDSSSLARPGLWAAYGIQGALAASLVLSAVPHIAQALRGRAGTTRPSAR